MPAAAADPETTGDPETTADPETTGDETTGDETGGGAAGQATAAGEPGSPPPARDAATGAARSTRQEGAPQEDGATRQDGAADGSAAPDGEGAAAGFGAVVGEPRTGPAQAREAADSGEAATRSVAGGAALLQPVPAAGGGTAVVEVFVPEAELASGVATAWLVLGALGLALVVGAVLVADRLGRRTVRATAGLAHAARELGRGRLGVRVPVGPDGPPELRSAALAFNAMADQVARLLANERELAADLSHRLRTPLTVLRLNTASLGEGDAAEQTRQAVAQLERQVDQIIRTARAQRAAGPGGGRGEYPDAAEVIRERMEFWSALAEDEGREASLAGVDQPLRVPVARAELAAALDALLGNVFRHTPEGTAFAVDVHRAGGAGDAVIVLVSDAGPGIADPEAALRRGQGAGGPGSTGLGLDIARRLAESTGGDLRIGRSVLGGAEIRLWLALDGGLAGRGQAPARRRGTRHRARGQVSPAHLPEAGAGAGSGKVSGMGTGSVWEKARRRTRR
ncbi:sensor histidine kinase [Streptomyces hoynatensis]|uniref:Signal transduction histidine-protein kinase/phosphatase MprB n=1 Tax=Streptomyces hoynatensis TaxID=1141874 RepID=A0A3A9YZD9_9ACTN|nr:sensor histidine kinase [Streptomyces hoynatensis]